jgi:hypothetical protein
VRARVWEGGGEDSFFTGELPTVVLTLMIPPCFFSRTSRAAGGQLVDKFMLFRVARLPDWRNVFSCYRMCSRQVDAHSHGAGARARVELGLRSVEFLAKPPDPPKPPPDHLFRYTLAPGTKSTSRFPHCQPTVTIVELEICAGSRVTPRGRGE